MRNLLCICGALLLLCACNGHQSPKETTLNTANKVQSEQKEKARKEKAHIDSISAIAWGSLKFGMSKEEVLKTGVLGNCKIDGNTISMDFDTRFKLEEVFRLKELRQFDVSFENDELTSVNIKSSIVDASHIDDLVNDCKILAKEFEKKMGKPYKALDEDPTVSSFNEGETFNYATFMAGDKFIEINMGETYDGSEYFYTVNINNFTYPKKHKKSQKQTEEENANDNELQKIKDNSF